MEREEKIALAEKNIRQAIADYRRWTTYTDVLDDVSERFVRRLARDNYEAKAELRELFRKSPAWNEELDAIVINGTRTHDPDYERIRGLAVDILSKPLTESDGRTYSRLQRAIQFFSAPDPADEDKALYIEAIKSLAPKAWSPTKKPSRVFKSLCDALGVTDEEKGSTFQKLYAQFADELTTKKINFKLFVSLNPAHFITMSNPKGDRRGNTLTSCHTFNVTDYEYNVGCTGYARDPYSFIVFTVADPKDAETLNNRKTMRQMFAYKPGNGVLLQSRLYNTSGGTYGAQAESKHYRDLIQREISDLENVPNLWRTNRYCGQSVVALRIGEGFGGYADWTYSDFDAKISFRADREGEYKGFDIGTDGICIRCADETSHGVYCEDCDGDNDDRCQCYECEEHFYEDDMCEVYDEHGHAHMVCESCRDNYYSYCEDCEEYFPEDYVHETGEGRWVCGDCLESSYETCDCCGECYLRDNMVTAVDGQGDEVYVCRDCADSHYLICDDCGRYVSEDDYTDAFNEAWNEVTICPDCATNYTECEDCGRTVHDSLMHGSLCEECAEVNDECEEVGEIA